MNGVLGIIALKHLLARRRQSLVSTLGIVLGVAFFLAVASLMQGSESDFIRRLVDSSPHITISDEFRKPHAQPAEIVFAGGAVAIRSAKPETETRGIRGYERVLETLRREPGVLASPVLTGQAIVTIAGKDIGVTLNGMIPSEVRDRHHDRRRHDRRQRRGSRHQRGRDHHRRRARPQASPSVSART